ncbi:MAG: amino acid adenylation domain-containing protein, partial [Paracoccaceae bacterium]
MTDRQRTDIKTHSADLKSVRDQIAAIWQEVLGCGPIGENTTFFEAGGTSLHLFKVHARMQEVLGLRFDMTQIFETPQLGRLAEALSALSPVKAPEPVVASTQEAARDTDIAIIGLAARVPGVQSLDAFWQAVCDGTNLIDRFDPAELEDGVSEDVRADPNFVPARSIIEDADMFDAKFFGILPAEADRMDPQSRVFLELCVHALDDAGLDPTRARDVIGVYAGSTMSTYLTQNVLGDRAAAESFTSGFQIGNYTTMTGNMPDTLATRVAFKLNLKGPAMTIGTACSTSLTAIAQAVAALRSGQCDVALAGGVSITFPQKRGYLAQEGGIGSTDGLCRPFDAEAKGTVFGHGAGVLVLKPLAQARADGDRVEAVIRGVGLNNDGSDKIAFTAPSVNGQAAAIQAAHQDAGVSADNVSYVECHGTATPLGDPIEIRGLSQAFGSGGRCALGSVKGNVGHLDAAAGVVGLIKTVRMLQEKVIPPVAHFQTLNPRIDFDDGPFFVPEGQQDWISDTPRRAGISGFGIGGTNVHLVLEEAPAEDEPAKASGIPVLPLSAKSPEALVEQARALAESLDRHALADVAYTLQEGRQQHGYRHAVAAKTTEDAIDRLRLLPVRSRKATDQPNVVFMFPGQGGQYPGMGSGLYTTEPLYAEWIDRGLDHLAPALKADLAPLLRADGDANSADHLRQTRLAQPALFLTQHACAQLWSSRGIEPSALIGHSIGEFAAAAVAGCLSFEDALDLVVARGALMQAQPTGAMLSVRATAEQITPYLGNGIDLAARNAPKLQVVAGPEPAIAALGDRLQADGIRAQKLQTSHAFHSAMMAPAAEAFAKTCADVTLSAPRIPIISTRTGDDTADFTDPAYWSGQMRAPVLFAQAIEAAAQDAPVLLEVGVGNTLSTFAAQTLKRDSYAATVSSLPDHARQVSDDVAIAQALGDLWSAGVPVDWSTTARGSRKLRLPGTQFMRKRHWIDPPPSAQQPAAPIHIAPIQAETVMTAPAPQIDRQTRLIGDLAQLFSDLSGEELSAADADASFLELGFDSLFMGQAAQALNRDYSVSLSFRALLSDYPSLSALAAHLDTVLPADPEPVAAPAPQPAVQPVPQVAPAPALAPVAVFDPSVASVMQAQLQTMQAVFAEQLRAVGTTALTPPAEAPASVAAPTPQPVPAAKPKPAEDAKPATFKVGRAPSLAQAELTPEQMAFVADLTQRYSARFPTSKAHTQENRAHHADPRSAAGFRPEWKELTFPIVAAESKGAYITDLDGNTFVDLVNGFGQTAFGHAPEFVSDAVRAQLDRGYAIGPQADMAGPVAAKFARLTGHERVTFCNTGSEAVMAAMRLARTVTGRETVVVFSNDYHGQFDEVLVKGKSRGEPGALPVAPGIPREAVSNMVVLDYGADATLDWLRDHIDQVAAVVVEPVQSRHPELRPADFVRSLRTITADGGAALVIDEVVTGFRTHMRGMQGVWDIQPDMATYGKVVGGGMPIGVLAGCARFMDALDGGDWAYGDDSIPQTAPTFFAGTFVRHPLVVAAVDVVLDYLETQGARLWTDAAEKASALAARMNAALQARGLPELVTTYSSWFVITVSRHDPRATLLHALMRLEGVHTLDGFCGFLTTEHTDADCDRVFAAFETALDALQSVGILAPEFEPKVLPTPESTAAQPIPLTGCQREIWMTHQLGDLPAASFNESVSLRFEGPLNRTALNDALADLVARHDALRMRFARDGATFEVQAPKPVALADHDLTTTTDPEGELRGLLRADAEQPVELITGYPLRGMLVKLADQSHVLVLTAHHIVCDGWSFNTLIEELGPLYTARCNGEVADLPAAPSFAELAKRQPETLSEETKAYWRKVYADVPTLPELPTDRPRLAKKTYAGNTTFAEFDGELLTAVRKAGAKQGCTLFATLFAAVQITIGRLSGANDVVLGVPTAGQTDLANPDTVGHLVNFLPIRAGFDPAEPVAQHLSRVAETLMAAFDHGDTTYGTLIRALDLDRTLSRLPLTELQFNLERLPEDIRMGEATVTMRANPKAAVNFDLFFNLVETRNGLRAEVDYNTHLFDETTVQRWLSHLRALLTALSTDSTTPIAALPLLSVEDEQALAHAYNPARSDYPKDKMLQDLVRQIADQTPSAVAITDADGEATYQDIWTASGALAARLQEVAKPGDRIGVAMPRDRSMPTALLAVLRAGMTYVPMDPYQPLARLRTVLEVSEASAVIAPDDAVTDLTAGLDVIGVDPASAKPDSLPRDIAHDPEAAAYIIFTSGSTGTPKGVAVPHRAVANFLTSMAQEPGFTADDKVLSVTTVSFDIAVLELFLPLVTGGQVEIASRTQVLDGFGLAERLAQPDITVMQATPTLWGMLVEAGFTPRAGLKMLAGGEPLPTDLAQTLSQGGELWNMYGPTETTIWSSVGQVLPDEPVTIGHPIANTDLHVLDAHNRLCPPGVIGELNIGGDGLAIGYDKRPDLTDAAFRMATIAGQKQRLYRTGDLAIRQPGGSLTLLGRQDGQVKLRGFRIELGEIEARLRADASVAKAAVALKTGASGMDRL